MFLTERERNGTDTHSVRLTFVRECSVAAGLRGVRKGVFACVIDPFLRYFSIF